MKRLLEEIKKIPGYFKNPIAAFFITWYSICVIILVGWFIVSAVNGTR